MKILLSLQKEQTSWKLEAFNFSLLVLAELITQGKMFPLLSIGVKYSHMLVLWSGK